MVGLAHSTLQPAVSEPSGHPPSWVDRLVAKAGGSGLDPADRAELIRQVDAGFASGRIVPIHGWVCELLRLQPDDYALLYLEARLGNCLGIESTHRERCVKEIVGGLSENASAGNEILRSRVEHPLLSIVVSTWNRLQSLRRLIGSLRQNTSIPFELIVCDNRSDDGAGEFLRHAHASHPWLSVVFPEGHLSVLDAYRLGTRIARGKILGSLADDIEVAPGWAEPLIRTLEEDRQVGVVTPVCIDARSQTAHLGSCVPYQSRRHLWMNRHGTFPVSSEAPPRMWVPPSRAMDAEGAAYPFLRREKLEALPIFDSRYVHVWDNDLALEVRARGLAIKVCPSSRIFDHDASRTREDTDQVVNSEKFFDRLAIDPKAAFDTLRYPESRPDRYHRDDFLLQCKWVAYRIPPCARAAPRAIRS